MIALLLMGAFRVLFFGALLFLLRASRLLFSCSCTLVGSFVSVKLQEKEVRRRKVGSSKPLGPHEMCKQPTTSYIITTYDGTIYTIRLNS